MTDLNLQLSEHFKAGEFQCHDGSPLPDTFAETIKDTVAFLEQLRTLVNVKIYAITARRLNVGLQIVSGHRALAYNRKIGSGDSSRHVAGQAADVRPVGGYKYFTYGDFHRMAESVDEFFPKRPYRIGKYTHLGKNAFVHVDCGYGHGGLRWGS